MNPAPVDRLEVLSVELLDKNRYRVRELRQLARTLGLELGWHYLLDMTWILSLLGDCAGKVILDAGAGTGVLQWYLAEHGADVYSVDRMSRAELPIRFRTRYRVEGVRPKDLLPSRSVFEESIRGKKRLKVKVFTQAQNAISLTSAPRRGKRGMVRIYNQDLGHMPDIPTASIDAVVSVSSLEHNKPENLPDVVIELLRVLKPGGALLASLNAAPEEDWFHIASSGWCYTAASLKRLFCLDPNLPHNYDRYNEILEELRACEELRENLASFYYTSGDNGMPWGKWDPLYVPVGVCKVKSKKDRENA